MSLKVFKILIVLFFCITGFTTCKKYPEDGKLSTETAKKRLKHKWELKECLLDGLDVTYQKLNYVDKNTSGQRIDSVIYSLKDFIIEFSFYNHKVKGQTEKVNNVSWIITDYYYKLNPGIEYGGSNEWSLEKNKNNLKFKTDIRYIHYFNYDDNNMKLLYNPSNESWIIKKLTDKEMILETVNSSNQTVRLKFNRL